MRRLLALASLLLLSSAWTEREIAKSRCRPEGMPGTASRTIYCVDLISIPGLVGIAGTVELRQPPESPFTVAVTREGVHAYDLVWLIDGLPSPRSLGGFDHYVAWITTPMLDPVIRVGDVRNGRVRAGRVALNKFLLVVTAERWADSAAPTWRGRLVLRGTSPSVLLKPVETSELPGRSTPATHDHGGPAPDSVLTWRMPPMHPQASYMVPGLEHLVPSARPWLPGAARDPVTFAAARPGGIVELGDGDTLRLSADIVRRDIRGRTFVMYGFNGRYPGPLVRVTERSRVIVEFSNHLDQPTAVHWHGIRLANRFDGVPHLTQPPVPPGGSFRYELTFPDAGVFWYHPHHREDIQQDLGLYGPLQVRSRDPAFFGPAHREESLMLDDLLLGDAGLVPFGEDRASHALMGRFGNVLLVNGEERWRARVRRGEVVRFVLTNVSNVRTFNLSVGTLPVKIVASDVSRFEREVWSESVVIAPAERYVIEARFPAAGIVAITNRVQGINHPLGAFFAEVDTLGLVTVADEPATPDLSVAYGTLRRNAAVTREVESLRARLKRPPDHELLLTLRVKRLPFGLTQVMRLDSLYANPVEWAGSMPMMDWIPTASEIEWVLRDPATGKENMAIDWRFRRGQLVRLKLVNDRHTLHAMQHPIHLHGQRFLVLARNGDASENLVWKDTVLLPAGGTAELLVEMSNPGKWMVHCHIAEHLEAGMHAVFTVQ